VDVLRFPMDLPADLTYGRVAQSRVSVLGKVARLASDCVVVPSESMQVIEDAHLAIVHAVVVAL